MKFLIIQDAVTVSTLPHPISMFFIGVTFIISLYLYFEVIRLRGEVRATMKENGEIKQKLHDTKLEVDRSVGELTKKVDSRVDKALDSLKKVIGK
jgi:uncharacterized membrane protein YecN with MAPEG domain